MVEHITYHSEMLVPRADIKPSMLKLSSYALHSAKPLMIGIREHSTNGPLCSPSIKRDMNTVNRGAELFTVSVNDTATYFRATKPRKTTKNLNENNKLP